VGDAAPAWKDLEGVDGQKHSLGEHADAKAVVVAFTCNHCPVAVEYEGRIVSIAEDYKDKGVEVVAINVSNLEQDKLPAMKKRAEKEGFNFDYLYDPSQEIGRAYGAAVTPHLFLLDGDRNVVYIGAIDDNMNEEKATKHYLRDAIDAVVAGSKPQTDSTKPIGCGIKYE
jgi:peroxiredoxin